MPRRSAAASKDWPPGRCPTGTGPGHLLPARRRPGAVLAAGLSTSVDGGLGVHLTLDLAGNARFGPDVQWIDDPDVQWIDGLDYTVNVDRVPEFVAAIERYWPAVTERELVADYAGIRPKLGGPGSPAADFRISTPADHGVPGLINLFGIESPGLTSSLAIAELVGAQIAGT